MNFNDSRRMELERLCAQLDRPAALEGSNPHAEPIDLSVVWRCDSIDQANSLLDDPESGFVYRRDSHPNARSLAHILGELHEADHVLLTAQGMSALSAAVLSLVRPTNHVVAARQLYGRSLTLLSGELSQWGVTSQWIDAGCLEQVENACRQPNFRLMMVETITNPCLEVPDLSAIATIVHRYGGLLLVDNTFATPLLCQPLRLGADLVLESLTKFISGHGDAMAGMLCGTKQAWGKTSQIAATWGLISSPMDCWLIRRGLATLPLRLEQACKNALALASACGEHSVVKKIDYPGLTLHPHHAIAQSQFGGRFGTMMTIHLNGGAEKADKLIRHFGHDVPFCPSLGECQTTLSHPESTSHRRMTVEQRSSLGIDGGTVRFSCGIEPTDWLLERFRAALEAIN